ncbi:MAG: uL15 family ribosomal protein [Candidatus Paceibacterota bacterium]|jgi:large subunit ribosomal protein L15|nr:uL15 family ribosomal protein [Candidatus Paceibacterota bacterium]
MQTHNITRAHPNKEARRFGRGGKRGKNSGHGNKGQKSRAGHRIRPEIRDIIKKLPKKRGYGKNRARSVVPDDLRSIVFNVGFLEKMLPAGEVSHAVLLEKGLMKAQKGKIPPVKILGNGEVTKKFAFKKLVVSEKAKEKITKAGGTVE